METTQIREKIKNEIVNRTSSKTFYDVLLTKTLKAKLERLDEIEEILSFEKYRIAFIGTVGAGKTTAICHLFNLLLEVDKEQTTNQVEVAEILKTGVGYTTLCEVELELSESESRIRIEPYSKEELSDLLSVFAEFIQNSISPDKDNPNVPGKQIISPELSRAIKNIVNLKDYNQETQEGGKKKIKKVDKCKEEFIKCGNLEAFKNVLFERANLEGRNLTEISYTASQESEKQWLKKNFDDVNSARLAEISLPKKIFIALSKKIVKESLFDYFDTIVDTKGLDANENRKDIDDYIKDRKTICIFTTEYKDAPDTNIRNLLEYHFNNKLANYQTKIVIVVLPQKGQPEGEQGAEDRDDGINIRRGIIQDVLNGTGITEIPDSNILFYDALRFYTKESNKIYFNSHSKKKLEDDRDTIVLDLLETIDKRKGFYQNELALLESDVNQIITGKGLSEIEEKLIIDTKSKIYNYSNLNFYSYKDLTDRFIDYFKYNYAPMTIKAINRRYGFYNPRGINIFYDAQKMSAEVILRTVTKDYSENILKILVELRKEIDNEDVRKLIDEIQTQFQYLYNNFIDEISTDVYKFLHDQKLEQEQKNSFWDDVIDIRGSGYRERVGATFRDELETTIDSLPDTNDYFKGITEDRWKNYVIANIANYFDK